MNSTRAAEHEIISSVSIVSTCSLTQDALLAQFTFFAWLSTEKCLVLRDQVSLQELEEDPSVTVGNRVLGSERGATVERWFCRWHRLLVGATAVFSVLSWLVDWEILQRDDTAQALVNLALSCCCALLMVSGLLCNRISVTRRVLRRKPIS